MGLKSDFEELKEVWKGSNLLFKILITVSTFLTFSAITSLADAVFSWKGFIRDGVGFYRLWINQPLSELIKYLGLNVRAEIIDNLVIILILMFSGIRSANYNRPDVPIGQKLGLYFVGIALIVVVAKLWAQGTVDHNVIYLAVLLVVFLVGPLLSKMPNKIIWYLPPICASLGVLILGAVNAGLARVA